MQRQYLAGCGQESPLRHSTASSQDRSGFRRLSFCFDTLPEIRIDHPVLLGMQGDTDHPHGEVQEPRITGATSSGS
jgi:hypothetical protein